VLEIVVGLSSLWVAGCYLIIGMLVIPGLRFPAWVTFVAGLFFVGCALTHAHIATEAFAAHHASASFNAGLMILLHVAQGIGGSGFVVAMMRGKLVVRLEK
jgi:hypothetical protein